MYLFFFHDETYRLEELEQALFRMGRRSRSRIDQWFSRHHERLEASRVAKATQIQAEVDAAGLSMPPIKRRCEEDPSAPLHERND